MRVPPPTWHHLTDRRQLGSGEDCFTAAVNRLFTWQIHRGAGLDVVPDGSIRVGSVHTLVIGPRWARLTAPVRVREVVDERTETGQRHGFVYETLPGHPEEGHESFVVEHDLTTDEVRFVIEATSRPGRWWVRLGGPVGRLAQQVVTRRYLAAARPADAGPRTRRRLIGG